MEERRKCYAGCPKRQVGCRTGCEIWARQEADKAVRYAKREAERASHFESPMAVNGFRQKVKTHKSGQHVHWGC